MTTELSDLYQELILDHYRRPRNRGKLDDANCTAEGDNPLCGDHVNIFVKVKDGKIEDITFEGSGCAISTASASIMTETLKGKTLEEAKQIFKTVHRMLTGEQGEFHEDPKLGKLEVFSGVCQYPARVKCATLAWHTVDAALNQESDVVTTEEQEHRDRKQVT
jgi:nitrogen fixation NifU-like protein